MILAADSCQSRAPSFYVADDLSEIASILNPKLGDVAAVIVEGASEFWRLQDVPDDSDVFDFIQSNTCSYVWVRAGSVVNVRIFGATGNGITDDTEYFQAAVDAARDGSIIYVPVGTYLLDNVQMPAKDLTIQMEPEAKLLMQANATGPMLEWNTSQTGGIYGGIIDGQKSLQLGAIWYPVVFPKTSTKFTIEGVTFQNCAYAAIQVFTSTGYLEICHNRFLNAAEHGGVTTTKASMSIYIGSIGINLSIHHNNFHQDAYPSVAGRAAGGILIAGCKTANVSDNTFFRVGQTFMDNHLAPIHFYESNDTAIICRNEIIEPMWDAIVVQNTYRHIITDNQIRGVAANGSNCAVGIWSNWTQRTQTAGPESAIIANNVMDTLDVGAGIFIYAASANAGRAIVVNNDIRNCLNGIRASGVVGVATLYDPCLIAGNMITGITGDYGIRLEYMSGYIRIHDNDVRVSTCHAIWALLGMENTQVDVAGNYATTDTVGFYAGIFRGMNKLFIHSGVFSNTGVGATALTVNQDANANLIQEAMINMDEITIPAGLTTITLADIVAWSRSVITHTADPNGSIQAPIGSTYKRTTGGAGTTFYVKEGALNTQWVGK